MRLVTAAGGVAWLIAGAALAQDPAGPDAMRIAIEGLRAPQPTWRAIPWQTCLIAGLQEARARKQPLLLWVFIDRPTDDARC
jgi:hypothetical protein